MVWKNWDLSRIMVLFTGLAFLMMFIQVTLFHYRQNFRNKAMWLPVIAGPLIALIAFLLIFVNVTSLMGPLKILLWLGLAGGIIGFYLHFRGVGQRVDGYVLRNFLVGPPVILPLMFSALAVIGLLAVYWR
jgi:lysylphosphatidylglycerol synthetase-like protein (DUF2156 family)